MGHGIHVTCGHRLNLFNLTVFLLIISSSIQQGFLAEGRKILKQSDFHQTVSEDKTMMKAQIGSRPPRCERRCSSCAHCEAIQVPTNPQVQNGKSNSSTVLSIAYYGRGDDSSNYKPMSWKCKCGNIIFNP